MGAHELWRGTVNYPSAGLDLYWLPLGAGGHAVRWSGRVYEAMKALRERRAKTDLYHSALVVRLPPDSWVIEMTPVWSANDGQDRGVVAEGAVGTHWLGRARFFRYEVRCWRGGSISDVDEAVGSPVRLTSDEAICQRLLSELHMVPTPVWGRDERGIGEMWNSNSVTAWVIACTGLDAGAIRAPAGGKAPGWNASVITGRTPGLVGAG